MLRWAASRALPRGALRCNPRPRFASCASFLDAEVARGRKERDESQLAVARELDALEARLRRYQERRAAVGELAYEIISGDGAAATVVSRHGSVREASLELKRLRASPVSLQGSGSLRRPRPQLAGAATPTGHAEGQRQLSVRQVRRTSPSEDFVPSQDDLRVPRGMYIFGAVGTGKSMLMDAFYSASAMERRRRVHFHDFMLDVHARVHQWKQQQQAQHVPLRTPAGPALAAPAASERDALTAVAQELARASWLLCFDEFQVTDVADALILRHLFGELWSCGSVVVATSNRPPRDLYQGGVNRGYFVPFVEALEAQCKVMHMRGARDYRLGGGAAHGALFQARSVAAASQGGSGEAGVPPELTAAHPELFAPRAAARVLPVMMGRDLHVPAAHGTTCRVSFAQLCEEPKGAADYRALSDAFETVVITHVPALTREKHNEARRFVTLVDQLYERRRRVVLHCTVGLDELFAQLAPAATAAPSGGEAPGPPPPSAPSPSPVPSQSPPTQTAELPSASPPELDAPYTHAQAQSSDPADTQKVSEAERAAVEELAFACRRAHSRLVEMTSATYATRPLRPPSQR